MRKLKIIYEGNPRGRELFPEGLIKQDNVEAFSVQLYTQNGKPLPLHYISPQEFMSTLHEFDFIIIPRCQEFFPGSSYWDDKYNTVVLLKKIDSEKLWDRVIVWDWNDGDDWWPWGLEKCLVYFKRELNWYGRTPGPKVYPLANPAFDLYFEMVPYDIYEWRDIDIGYYYGIMRHTKSNNDWSHYRAKIAKAIMDYEWKEARGRLGSFCVDMSYTSGKRWQGNTIYDSPYPWMFPGIPNTYYLYWHLLRRTKVVFNVDPQYGDHELGTYCCGGAYRNMECLCSGALAIIYKPTTPMPNWFEHGKHCFFFDIDDPKNIREMMGIAEYYIMPEHEEERKRIARASYELALNHHKTEHYVKYALDIAIQKAKELGRTFE